MKKTRNFILHLAATVLSTAVVVTALYALTKGWPLLPSPKLEELDRVRITNTELGVEKEIEDAQNMELAVKLLNFLNVIPFSSASDPAEPVIEISYCLKDGTILQIAVNHTDVYWKNRGHQLKEEDTFVQLAKGIFFSEEYAARDSA